VDDITGLSEDERLQLIEDLQEDRAHTLRLVHELWVHQTELEMQHAELQQTQERLQQERDRYQELYQNAPVGYLTTTRRGTLVDINATAVQLLGIDQQQPTEHRLQQFIVPDDQDTYYFHLQNLFGSMRPQTCELRMQRRDGTLLFIRLESTFAEEKQAPPYCRTALLDITAQKRAEQALHETNAELEQRVAARTADLVAANTRLQNEINERQQAEQSLRSSEARFATFMQHFPGLAYIHDQTGRVVFANATYCQNLDRPSAQVIGQLLSALFPSDLVEYLRSQDHQVLTAHQVCTFEDQWEFDGHMRIFLSIKFPMDRSDGTCDIGGVAIDITSRKQLEADLRHARDAADAANHAKSEFLAHMSHEIRTPLNAVIGLTNLLLKTPLNTEQQDYVETVHLSGEVLLTIINDILDFSKIEAGQLKLETSPFSLRTCVEEVLKMLLPRAEEKGLELVYWMDSEVPDMLLGDITRVRQILINLMSNGVKFTDHGEVVVIVENGECRMQNDKQTDNTPFSTLHSQLSMRISVRDTGIGIPPERLESIFESFAQGDSSTTRRYEGSGLGLAISKRLAEMMGGTLEVESKVGVGSTFQLTLKAEPIATEPPPFLLADQPDLQGKQLFVVDNHATSHQILCRYAEQWGMHAQSFNSLSDALAGITHEDMCDTILLNMHMHEMEESALTMRIQDAFPVDIVPIIVLMPVSQRYDLHDVAPTKMTTFLIKPIRPAALHTTLVSIARGETMENVHLPDLQMFDAQEEQHQSLRILLAEDNVINQKVALSMLEKMGYHADVASTGSEVLQALHHQTYDIVLMDVQMPEMDGIEATKRIRAQLPPTEQPYIIALTAHALANYHEQCLEAGMDDYIDKPVQMDILAARLKQIIRSSKPETSEPDSLTAWPDQQTTSASPVTTLDPTKFAQFWDAVELGEAGVGNELIVIFLEEVPGKLTMLRQALTDENAHTLSLIAHSLKSSSAQLGALHFSTLCRELETIGQSADLTGAADTLSVLEAEYVQVEAALRDAMAGR
jgi:PAS domain S-box-containing protein